MCHTADRFGPRSKASELLMFAGQGIIGALEESKVVSFGGGGGGSFKQ